MIIEITCPKCNFSKQVSQEKIPPGIKFAKCPRCNENFELPVVNDEEKAPREIKIIDTEPIDPVPAETSPVITEEAGYFSELLKSLKEVLFSPASFFNRVKGDTGLGEAFAFGILLGSIGAMFTFFWQFILQEQDISYITRLIPETASINSIFFGLIVVSPFLVLINVIVTAFVIHVSLAVLQGATKGITGTLKVILYSNAASIFSLVPYVGGIVAFIWSLTIIITGLREIHEISGLKALSALLLPLFFMFILTIFAAVYLASKII